MVISIPSANWAQFSAEGTAVLEIDLLKVQQASQPAASASKPITQLVAQPLCKSSSRAAVSVRQKTSC